MRRNQPAAKNSAINSMSKKIFCLALSAMLLGLSFPAEAQPQAKVSKIGWLSARPASNSGQEVIVRMLRDLGYVESKNIAFEYRYANNQLDRFPALADELVRLKVDVLLTPGTPGALALKNATKTIPILFLDVTDPVAAGLVDSLARPGGKHHGVQQHRGGVGGQTAGVTQGNCSQDFTRCRVVECA